MGLTLCKALGDYDGEAEDVRNDLVMGRMRARDELEEVVRRLVRLEQEVAQRGLECMQSAPMGW